MNLLQSLSTTCFLCLLINHICSSEGSNSSDSESSLSSEELSVSNKIFNGLMLPRDNYMYVARLQTTFRGGSTVICSGVVMSTKIVLTLAHCVSQRGGQNAIRVLVTLPSGGRYTFNENEIIINFDYTGLIRANIAVLRKDTQSATFIRGINNFPTLPPSSGSTYTTGQQAVVVGWGRTDDNGRYPSRPQYATVNIADDVTCADAYPEESSILSTETLICTFRNIEGICEGDWGGPLLVTDGGITTVIGLSMTRKSFQCNNYDNAPSAYYNLQPKAEWLRNTFNLR